MGISRARGKRLLTTFLIVALVVGIGVVGGLATHFFDKDKGPSYPKAWDPRIAPLAAIASKDRGLSFKHPVYVDFLSEKEFAKQVTTADGSLTAEDRNQIAQTQGLLRAMGVISGKTDLLAAVNTLHSSAVIGLYDFQDKRIRVRGTELTPAVKVTLVHELTHVLQDQNFDLGATTDRLNASETEDGSAFTAIVEGDASRIEDEYKASLPKATQEAINKASEADGARYAKEIKGLPGFLVTELQAPYVIGNAALTTIAKSGGNQAVDALFKSPPKHQIYILRPWLLGQAWTSPTFTKPALPAGAKDDQRGEFGAFDLFLVLTQRVPLATALKAADGWAADQYVSYTQGTTSCMKAAFTGQDASATGRLEAAWSQWAHATPKTASVTLQGSTVTLVACDPGTGYTAPVDHSADALTLVAIRQSIEGDFAQHYTIGVSTCFADAMSWNFTIAKLTSNTPSTADTKKMRSFLTGCTA